MNIKLEINEEKYEIVATDYNVDPDELADFGYEVFGFNPDGSIVLLADQADSGYSSERDAIMTGIEWLLDMLEESAD